MIISDSADSGSTEPASRRGDDGSERTADAREYPRVGRVSLDARSPPLAVARES